MPDYEKCGCGGKAAWATICAGCQKHLCSDCFASSEDEAANTKTVRFECLPCYDRRTSRREVKS